MASIKNINNGQGQFTILGNIAALSSDTFPPTPGNSPGNGGYLFGNGYFLTGISGGGVGGYGDSNVALYLSSGNLTANIIPSGNNQTLGNATNPWKTLYVSGNTIVIGTANLTTANSTLFVNGQQVVTTVLANSTTTILGNLVVGNNVTATSFTGDGSGLSNVPSNYSNANVGLYLNSGLVNSISVVGNIFSTVITGNDMTVVDQLNVGNTIYIGNVEANSTATLFTRYLAVGDIYNPLFDPANSPTITNTIQFNGANIANVGTPVDNYDAATKQYVDVNSKGIQVKTAVDLATVSGLGPITYNNGNAGVGATITSTGTGNLFVDGIAAVNAMRILVKSQGNAVQNGIYDVTDSGNVSAPFILTRSTDCDEPQDFPSAYVLIDQGATQQGDGWICTNTFSPPVVVGTTPITWQQFSSTNYYQPGNGLSLTGNTFSVNVDPSWMIINANNQITSNTTGNLTIGNVNLNGDIIMPPADGVGNITNINLLTAYDANIGNLSVSTSSNILLGNVTVTPVGIMTGVANAEFSTDAVNLETMGFYSGYDLNIDSTITPPNASPITGYPNAVPGAVRFDSSYLYVCISEANGVSSWNRVAWTGNSVWP
jgi:hypothetical protein